MRNFITHRRSSQSSESTGLRLALWLGAIVFLLFAGSGRASSATSAISGLISGEDGAPLAGMIVTAYHVVDVGDFTSELQPFASATTGPDGAYTLTLPGAAESIRVGVRDHVDPPRYRPQFYPNATAGWDGELLSVAEGKTLSGIDLQLTLGGNITGRVTLANGAPIVGIIVRAWQPTDDGAGGVYWQPMNYTEVGANGAYTLTLAYSGAVRISFEDVEWPVRYQAEYYDNVISSEPADGTDVPVSIGALTTGIDAQLDALGRIQGVITDIHNQPLPEMTIQGYQLITDAYGAPVWADVGGYAVTDVNGAYDMAVSQPGVTRVCIAANDGRPYIPECYGGETPETGADIPVTLNQVVTGIDVQINALPRIVGRVVDAQGDALANAEIVAWWVGLNEAEDPTPSGFWSGWSDEQGNYEVQLGKTGRFRSAASHFTAPDGPFVDEWHRDAPTFEQAEDIDAQPDAVIRIDYEMPRMAETSGRVTGVGGAALTNIQVDAYQFINDSEGGRWQTVKSRVTDADGHYSFIDLQRGDYRFAFSDPSGRYEPQFFSGAATLEEAQTIAVIYGATRNDVDVRLAAVTGKITIVLDSVPDSRQNVRFTGDLGAFRLDDSGINDRDPFTRSATFNVPPGVYTVTQQLPYGFYLTDVRCTVGENTLWRGASVVIAVTAYGHVTCTFVIERSVILSAFIYHDQDGNGAFNLRHDRRLAGWQATAYNSAGVLVASGVSNGVGLVSLGNQRAGAYVLCEFLKTSWLNTQPGVIDPTRGQPCVTVNVAPGQSATVRFGNVRANTVIVATDPTQVTGTVEVVEQPDVSDDDAGYTEPDASGMRVFLPLVTQQ